MCVSGDQTQSLMQCQASTYSTSELHHQHPKDFKVQSKHDGNFGVLLQNSLSSFFLLALPHPPPREILPLSHTPNPFYLSEVGSCSAAQSGLQCGDPLASASCVSEITDVSRRVQVDFPHFNNTVIVSKCSTQSPNMNSSIPNLQWSPSHPSPSQLGLLPHRHHHQPGLEVLLTL